MDHDWQVAQLLAHFRAQMARRSLLVWGTGLEGSWRIDPRLHWSRVRGLREVSGPLSVVGGVVLVTNYESLTMAAQFAGVHLPEEHQRDHVVELVDGEYRCRVVQMFDPSEKESAGSAKPDFVLEFTRPSAVPSAWSELPWYAANPRAAADRGA